MSIFTTVLPNRALRRAGLVLAAAAMAMAAFVGSVQPAQADGSVSFNPCQVGLCPDLVPVGLKATRLNPKWVEFEFTVKNQGSYSAKAGSFTVLVIDGMFENDWTGAVLAPGANHTYNYLKYQPLGTMDSHKMGVRVDANLAVTETNENNNWSQISFR